MMQRHQQMTKRHYQVTGWSSAQMTAMRRSIWTGNSSPALPLSEAEGPESPEGVGKVQDSSQPRPQVEVDPRPRVEADPRPRLRVEAGWCCDELHWPWAWREVNRELECSWQEEGVRWERFGLDWHVTMVTEGHTTCSPMRLGRREEVAPQFNVCIKHHM